MRKIRLLELLSFHLSKIISKILSEPAKSHLFFSLDPYGVHQTSSAILHHYHSPNPFLFPTSVAQCPFSSPEPFLSVALCSHFSTIPPVFYFPSPLHSAYLRHLDPSLRPSANPRCFPRRRLSQAAPNCLPLFLRRQLVSNHSIHRPVPQTSYHLCRVPPSAYPSLDHPVRSRFHSPSCHPC